MSEEVLTAQMLLTGQKIAAQSCEILKARQAFEELKIRVEYVRKKSFDIIEKQLLILRRHLGEKKYRECLRLIERDVGVITEHG